MHRTLLAVDIEGSGHLARDNAAVVDSRATLFTALEGAFTAGGIPWEACAKEHTGYGMVVIVPPEFPKPNLVHPLLHHLADTLRAHNRAAADNRRVRVRAAIHAGDLLVDDYGTTGRPQVHLARLLGSGPLRDALARAPHTATVALLVSDHFFRDVVSQGHRGIDPDTFTAVSVDEKETEAPAWLHVIGHVGPLDATGDPRGGRTPAVPPPTSGGVHFNQSSVQVHGGVYGGDKHA